MFKKIALGFIMVALVAAGGAAYWWYVIYQGNGLRFSGIVEIQEVRLGSKVGGRVAKVLIEEGSVVSAGKELIVFEAPELENMKQQLQARLDAVTADYERIRAGARAEEKRAALAAVEGAKARLDKLKIGFREEEKRTAVSELETATADLKHGQSEYERIGQLYRQGTVARADYDSAVAARDQARGRFHQSRAKVDMMNAGMRPEEIAEAKAELDRLQAKYEELMAGSRIEDIALAKARVDEARAKYLENEIHLKEAMVRVPEDIGKAVVEVIAIRAGDLVPANQPVVRVLKAEDLWVKIFVPETRLGLVKLNQPVEVTIDTFPGKIFQGKIIQVSSASEFTPRNVQSYEERRYQVFGVKIRVDDTQGVFHSGMAAEVRWPIP